MSRLFIILVACTLLSGCATLTVATVGGLLAVGAVTGVGRFAGEQTAKNVYKRYKRQRAPRQERQRVPGDWWQVQGSGSVPR